jgi:hypothetical protein
MNKEKRNNVIKVASICEEVDAAYQLLFNGLKVMNDVDLFSKSTSYPLHLMSFGFERLSKIILLLHYYNENHTYPELKKTKHFFSEFDGGHGIDKMINKIISKMEMDLNFKNNDWALNQITFLKENEEFKTFIKILTEYSKYQRFYFIDRIASNDNLNNTSINPYQEFSEFYFDYLPKITMDKLIHTEEEKIIALEAILKNVITGITSLARNFTHSLGENGKIYYGDFSLFLLKSENEIFKLL